MENTNSNFQEDDLTPRQAIRILGLSTVIGFGTAGLMSSCMPEPTPEEIRAEKKRNDYIRQAWENIFLPSKAKTKVRCLGGDEHTITYALNLPEGHELTDSDYRRFLEMDADAIRSTQDPIYRHMITVERITEGIGK